MARVLVIEDEQKVLETLNAACRRRLRGRFVPTEMTDTNGRRPDRSVA